MSRSYRKTPIIGVSGSSDKYGKQKANRKFRKKSRLFLEDGPKKMREVSEVWDFGKDGKVYLRDLDENSKWLRK